MFGRRPLQNASRKSSLTALQDAVKLLSSRAYSEKKLRDKLRAHGHAPEEMDSAIQRLIAERLLDDRHYAESFIRTRLQLRPRSATVLVRELVQQGISPALARQAASDLAPREQDDVLAREIIRRKEKQYSHLDENVRNRRLTALLARRGFSPDIIRKALSLHDLDETSE